MKTVTVRVSEGDSGNALVVSLLTKVDEDKKKKKKVRKEH